MTTLGTPPSSVRPSRTFSAIASAEDGVTQLHVVGDVDMATADELREVAVRAITAFTGTVRVDLSQVTFMDSTGLNALIAIRNHCEPHHVLVLEGPPPQVRRILEVSGLDGLFTIEP